MQDSGLICPNCNGCLKEAFAEANYGRVLLLDQCEGCGGVWFDHWELYLMKEAEARRLDSVNEELILSSIPHLQGEGIEFGGIRGTPYLIHLSPIHTQPRTPPCFAALPVQWPLLLRKKVTVPLFSLFFRRGRRLGVIRHDCLGCEKLNGLPEPLF